MSRKNKSYLAELKYQAVGDHLSGGGALREICKKYGIRDKHTLQDWIKLLSEECRPRSKGAAPSGSADLMQNLPRISRQFQPMQRIPTKKPTVQKPCIDRADPEFSGLHNKKERQILRFDVQNLVHLQGLEPWAH